MAEITVKRLGELLKCVLGILIEHPDGLPVREVIREVENKIPLTDFEKTMYPERPDVRRFDKILRFCTITAVKAGWMIKTKGRWIITDEGRNAYIKFPNPEALKRESNRLYKDWLKTRAAAPESITIERALDEAPVATSITLEEAEDIAWEEIQKYLQQMDPHDFEKLVAALLRAMGYHVSWVAPPGKDGGIDIIAHNDPLGIQAPRIKVQVKRHAEQRVTVVDLRSFMALLGDQDVGLFVSLSGFTGDAESEARRQETRKITLLDLEKLFDLWVENYSKIGDAEKQFLPLKPIHYLARPE